MTGEQVDHVVAARRRGLGDFCDAPVELAPPTAEQARVRDFLDERVVEGELGSRLVRTRSRKLRCTRARRAPPAVRRATSGSTAASSGMRKRRGRSTEAVCRTLAALSAEDRSAPRARPRRVGGTALSSHACAAARRRSQRASAPVSCNAGRSPRRRTDCRRLLEQGAHELGGQGSVEKLADQLSDAASSSGSSAEADVIGLPPPRASSSSAVALRPAGQVTRGTRLAERALPSSGVSASDDASIQCTSSSTSTMRPLRRDGAGATSRSLVQPAPERLRLELRDLVVGRRGSPRSRAK